MVGMRSVFLFIVTKLAAMSPLIIYSQNFDRLLPPPTPSQYGIETAQAYFIQMNGGVGGGGGESFLPFYHDAMMGDY